MTKSTEEIKDALRKKTKKKPIEPSDYLSTGSTVLNLACTGKANGGFIKGKYYILVGDSSSGKTFLSLTCLAEASINKNFDDYRFIYDNSEDGALMDIQKFFGSRVAKRLEAPSYDKHGNPLFSTTIDEFYFHLEEAKENGKPFIYIQDSMDALSSKEELAKAKERRKAFLKGTETTGSYGDGKAKKNASGIRQLIPFLRKSGSILIIICQTRDNVGTLAFEKKTRSGGRALKFYATLELWSSVVGKIKKVINDKPRQIGTECQVIAKKNRMTGGTDQKVVIPIYRSFGIDDLGSCIDFLLEEKHWKKTKDGIDAKEFDFVGKKEKLIRHIEENELEKDLREIVADTWNEIEEQCSVRRKRRYE